MRFIVSHHPPHESCLVSTKLVVLPVLHFDIFLDGKLRQE